MDVRRKRAMRHLRRTGACAAVVPQTTVTVNRSHNDYTSIFQVVSGDKLLSEKNDTETKKLKRVMMNDVVLTNPDLMLTLTYRSGFVLSPKHAHSLGKCWATVTVVFHYDGRLYHSADLVLQKPESYRLACQTNVGDGSNKGTIGLKTKPP